jgi:hypothetical protein
MLFRKIQEPLAAISKETRRAEELLFHRLQQLALNIPFLFDCSVQQLADDEFVAVLTDPESGAEVCAWTGTADGVVVDFEAWIEKKYPHPARALAE